MEFDPEVIDHLRRQRKNGKPEFSTLGARAVVLSVGVVSSEVATGKHFEGLGAEAKFFVHAFVIGARNERHADLKADRLRIGGGITLTKSLAADAVGATGALLKNGGVPSQIIMDNVTAVAM